ncbi:hypothetical protein ACQKH5_04005 [Hyphomonas sp. NPDC076900]|uniref:hypothetical protein n=1 Tax=unclassified Hyphomonas TaxID=2630699 RepID=UPI003D042E63
MAVLLIEATAAAEDLSNQYDLAARFDPASGAISAHGTFTVVADGDVAEIRLLLNSGVTISQFTFGGGEAARIEPVAMFGGEVLEKTQAIIVTPERPLQKGDRLEMAFAYDGHITTDDIFIGRGVVSPGWTEMTLETLWYPVWLEEALVRSQLTLEVPEAYEVAGPGKAVQTAPGRWTLDPGGPVGGRITFAMSDSWVMETRELGSGLSARLYSVVPEPKADDILGTVGDAYSYYAGMFGPPRTDKSAITLLYPNIDPGLVYPNQAYATAGDFIVMNLSDLAVQLDTLNHEVAHLWWSAGQPGTADEFLSESFAEYLAMRRGEAAWGKDWLATRRAALDEAAAEAEGSILTLNGFGAARHSLLYEKGPSLLWKLQDSIGEDAMDGLLRAAYEQQTETLEGFLTLMAEREGEQIAGWFRESL